ncbi:uncharacterized protein LOC109850824 isoform X2 [Asparagus officinalis]|uniref:uncharacterized protein LOC109850824 isoform X2 n=1 Tax=Asparagus officinalis TaxID=4686 RepID=UPI00098E281C|nr:uncharacterized protein LOC109850824 isoform X2 [Asparagus officinalis]
MAPSLNVKHFCFAIAMLTLATPLCKGQSAQPQDSVQIVANAALCFDNKTVIMNCISSAAMLANGSLNPNSTFCQGPCYGHAMLMVNCLDGIFTNFPFYNAGLFQGVRAIFQVVQVRTLWQLAMEVGWPFLSI